MNKINFRIRHFLVGMQNVKRHWWKLGSFDQHMHGYLSFTVRTNTRFRELEEKIEKLEQQLAEVTK